MTRYGDYTFDPDFVMPTALEPPSQPATPPPPKGEQTTKDGE
jgi:hypothetical protein